MLCTLTSPGRKTVLSTEAPRRAVTLDEVRAHRDVILRLGQRFGVRNIRVFGSVARGEATAAGKCRPGRHRRAAPGGLGHDGAAGADRPPHEAATYRDMRQPPQATMVPLMPSAIA